MPVDLHIDDTVAGRPISPLIYGSNEIGVMDKGLPSATLDVMAGVTARRLGGDLMTAYNWVNNATNAGKNHRQSNGPFLLEALQIPKERWSRPAVVIEAMHAASLGMGATSLVTLPLAGYAAADLNGPVAEGDSAPSRRFVEVVWRKGARADAAIDPSVCDIGHLVARLVAQYGPASSGRGIAAYALDNEPEIWFENHPRLLRQRPTIAGFIARSISAARILKSIDPSAKLFGPASWGATGMISFQDAPDWPAFQHYGSFLAAYLDAFRIASEQAGIRLLDMLDVHWYPFHAAGKLFRSEDPLLDAALLDAPRSLTEPGFVEESWVARALRNGASIGLGLPILPHLTALVQRWFPGTGLAVTEFNYGGAGRLAAGLALADALGRFGRSGVGFASHWGSLDGWLKEAYRLYRLNDATGLAFGPQALPVQHRAGTDLCAYAARNGAVIHIVMINKGATPRALDLSLASRRLPLVLDGLGFDSAMGGTASVVPQAAAVDGGMRLVLPPRAARRYALG